MKSLVVFYSRTGNTKKIAEEIAVELNSDIEEIVDKKNRKGFLGFLIAGKDAVFNKFTQIEKKQKRSFSIQFSNYWNSYMELGDNSANQDILK